MALPPCGTDGPILPDFWPRNSGALRSIDASVLGFCVGSELPLRSHLPYESAVRRPDNRAPWANPAHVSL